MKIPVSIRWRLPLTYAAIALLTVVSLGIVLLTTLRTYYSQRELDYLNRNANAIGHQIVRIFHDDAPLEAKQALLENFSFLSQARVRLMDTNGQLVAESGNPTDFLISLTYSRIPEQFAPQTSGRILIERVEDTTQAVTAPIQGPNPPPELWEQSVDPVPEYVPMMGIIRDTSPWTAAWTVSDEESSRLENVFFRVGFAGTPFGPELNLDARRDGPRSNQSVQVELFAPDNNSSLGFVELSEGPAYGTEIIQGVILALVGAGAVAIALAAGVGWYISQRITAPVLLLTDVTGRMAGGQLSARAQLAGDDEFGLLARSFNDMAGKVEGTVIMLRRFVADAAHELHTPLTALHANLELAATEENETRRLTFIERALDQLKRLETLTSSLLDLSRIETRSDQAERHPVDLVELVKESSELYASRAEQAGLCFYFDLPDEQVIACVNDAQLRRAVGNLLDNSIKFTPAEGVIGIGLQRTENRVELWVKDTGIGIPAEDLPLVFSRFHRARNTAAYPGSGLGLAIIKAIIEGHSGQVMVKSTAQGTHFSLQLPIGVQ
jgi:signal transduction histidine kinase